MTSPTLKTATLGIGVLTFHGSFVLPFDGWNNVCE